MNRKYQRQVLDSAHGGWPSIDFSLAAASVVTEGFTGRNFSSHLPITRAGTTLGRRTVPRHHPARPLTRRFAWQPSSIFIRLQ